jgi:hypothetical protein
MDAKPRVEDVDFLDSAAVFILFLSDELLWS